MDSALMLEAKDFGLCFAQRTRRGYDCVCRKKKATFKGE